MPDFNEKLELACKSAKETENIRAKAYADGFTDGVNRMSEQLRALGCDQNQRQEPDVIGIIDSFIYELCKELDISSQGIRGATHLSLDERAAMLADRVKKVYG